MNIKDNKYEQLRLKLSRWPVKLPSSPEIIPILKLLFKDEELDLLLTDSFSSPYKDRKTIEQVAEEQSKPEEDIDRIMNSLADRGLLFRFYHEKDKKTYFSLLPILPGFFEFYLVGESETTNRNKFSELIEKYYISKLAQELGASKYSWVRVLPSEKNLQVNIELDSSLEILSFERVSDYIRTSKKIALMNCACRIKNPCEHPNETCMCFDYYADYMAERGLARYLSIEDALEKLREFEEHGLVHTTTNCQSRPQFICNCCTCSCLVLRGLVELKQPRCLTKSNFLPEWNGDDCNLCEVCVEFCPTGAIRYTDSPFVSGETHFEGRIVIDEEECIGCGLCVSNCEPGALSLVKIRDDLPEGTLRGMWMRAELERAGD